MVEENINKEKIENFKKELLLEEGFFTGNLKRYRQIYHLLDNFLKKNVDLPEKDSTLYQECQNLLIKLKWYSFNYLTFKEVIESFRNNISSILSDKTYPLEENLKVVLITIPLLEERDIYKKQLREALQQNQEKITSQNISIGDEQAPPTIASWLRSYGHTLGAGPVDNLKLAEFLVKDKDVANILSEEKDKIKRLLNLYEKLKLSSQDPKGMEEEEYQREGDKLILMRGAGIQETIRLGSTTESKISPPSSFSPSASTAIPKTKSEETREESPIPSSSPSMAEKQESAITELPQESEASKISESQSSPEVKQALPEKPTTTDLFAESLIKAESPQEAEIQEKTEAPAPLTSEAPKTDYEGIDEEIEKTKKEMPTLPTEGISYEQAIKNVVEQTNLSFPDETIENRFKNIITSYLKNVRDEIETRLVLKRPQKIGGTEYEESKVDEIIKFLKEQKPKIKSEIKPISEKASLAEGLVAPTEIIGEPEEIPIEGGMPVPPEPKEEIKKVEEKVEPEAEEEIKKPSDEAKQKFEMGPLSSLAEEKSATADLPASPAGGSVDLSSVDTSAKESVRKAETEASAKEDLSAVASAKVEVQESPEPQKDLEVQNLQEKSAVVESQEEVSELSSADTPTEITKLAEETAKTIEPTLPPKKQEFTISESPQKTEPLIAATPETPMSSIEPQTKEEIKQPSPSIEEKKPEISPEEPVSPKDSPAGGPMEQASIQIHRPPLESTKQTVDLSSPALDKTEEIKTTPKIYGPVDELRTIKVEDWRRWGSTKEAAERILDKINLLAEESLAKKAEAVHAWKDSVINKLYLGIGTEAIDTGKSVEEVIKTRQTENRPTLTLEEFNAVVELNQKMRF